MEAHRNKCYTPDFQQLKHALPAIHIAYSGQRIMITSNLKKWLKNHISKTRILHYWEEHNKNMLHADTDIETFTHAVKHIPTQLQLWLPK